MEKLPNIIIAGAAGGMGQTLANTLANKVDKLLILDINQQALTVQTEQLIATSSAEIDSYCLDLTVADQVQKYLKSAIDYQCIINLVGISINGSVGLAPEALQVMLAANLLAQVNLVNCFLGQQHPSNINYFIHLASLSAMRARAGMAGYAASKFAALGFNQALFKEYAVHNVKFTSICPAMVATSQTDQDTDFLAKSAMLQPDVITKVILYLLKLPQAVCIEKLVLNNKAQLAKMGE